jgi:membrane protein implicated in regulation of membrane protease activity
MYDLFFEGNAAWFSIPALLGSVFFLFRIAMLLLGAGHDAGLDLHGDVAHGDLGGHATDAHSDSTHSFQILSVQSIAAFLMGFGWFALAGHRAMHWQLPATLGMGVAGGVGMCYLLAVILRGMADLQSSGTVSIRGAMGQEGDVYVTVPCGGRGQVRVSIGDRQRIYNAMSGGEDLPTGTRIRVIKVNPDNTLTVARA